MKVSLDIEKSKSKNQSINFEGSSFVKSNKGNRQLEVAYTFDPDKKDCYLEIYKLGTDNEGNYRTIGKAYRRGKPNEDFKLSPNGANRVDLAREYGIEDNSPFAYHFLLVDKNSKFVDTRIDAGEMIDETREHNDGRYIFNVITQDKSNISKGGSMRLVIADAQHVGYVYDDDNNVIFDQNVKNRADKGLKSITNKVGGTIAGLEHGLDNGEYDSYTRIIGLPFFTDDDFSAHAYWNKNCMQMAHSLGNINNYASFQRKLFKKGMNYVSDGAFVNEGLMGVHFNSILKWAEDSPYFYWFKASGLKDSPLSLGIFSKNHEFISHKLVNSPYRYTQDPYSKEIAIAPNLTYDKTKPTYFQIFDNRLVSREEREDSQHIIKSYSKMSTEDDYDMHTHDDSVQPYYFEINPDSYNRNVKNLNEYNRSLPTDKRHFIDDYLATRVLAKFKNYSAEEKFESGFETWNANPDIAKLNFVFSNADNKRLKNLSPDERAKEEALIKRGNMQTQDYAVTSGIYWTQKTDDILRTFIAQNLKDIDTENPSLAYDKILKLVRKKEFPQIVKSKVSKEEVINVVKNRYNTSRELSEGTTDEQILEGLMNTPLDSIELGDNIVSILASPMISKRAATEDEIGVPRYEIYLNGNANLPKEYKKTYTKMDNLYKNEMSAFAKNVLNDLNDKLGENQKLFNGNKVTEFGQYVLPLLTSEIARYAVIKALAPNAQFKSDNETGEISYNYKELKNTHLQSLNLPKASSVEDEAQLLLNKLQQGLKNLDGNNTKDLSDSFAKMLNGTNLASFKLADLIIDKTQSGLDWRLDAVKDMSDIEDLKNNQSSFDYIWKTVSDFWAKFTHGVLSKNPNAYVVGEITDENDIHRDFLGTHSARYPKNKDIIPKFERETGMTSIANYSYFFTDIPKMFAKCFEDGKHFDGERYLQEFLFKKFTNEDDGKYIRTASLDSLMYSYTFIGNHDKPRALHCLAMDMELFYTNLNDKNNFNYRKKAFQAVNDRYIGDIQDYEVNNFDYSYVSPKAVAMAEAIRPSVINVLNKYRDEYHMSQEDFDKNFIALSQSISELTRGEYLKKKFNPDAFGTKPYDVAIKNVLKQAEREHGLTFTPEMKEKFANEVFESVMTPALTKLLAIMKFLVALPGMPTMLDGDDMGSTGYDTKTRNIYLDGRQKVNEEWVQKFDGNNKYKEFLNKYKGYFDEVFGVRTREELGALNNGAIFTLPLNKAQNGALLPSLFRQSTDGKMAITIFNPTGLHTDNTKSYMQHNTYLDRLYFTEDYAKSQGINGIKKNTKFINAKNKDDIYETKIDENGFYYLTRMCDGKEVPMPIEDSTLILYSVPKKSSQPVFTGTYNIKPTLRTITKSYSSINDVIGEKISLYK